MNAERLSESLRSSLREMANAGAARAADALGRMTGRTFHFQITNVTAVTLEEVLGDPDETVIFLRMRVEGGTGGTMVAVFSASAAFGLLSGLLGSAQRGPLEALDPLAVSALLETGNILGGAYISAVGRLLGRRLTVSPPSLSVDRAGAAFEMLRADVPGHPDSPLVLEAVLGLGEGGMSGRILFLPHLITLEALLMGGVNDQNAEGEPQEEFPPADPKRPRRCVPDDDSEGF